MRNRLRINLLFILPLVSACSDIDEKDLFLCPVTTVEMPSVTGHLAPELMTEFVCPEPFFKILDDSVMVAYLPQSEYSLNMFGMAKGDTLASICRMGRGPDEFLALVPYYGIEGPYAHLVDDGTFRYSKVHLYESMRRNHTVIENSFPLYCPEGYYFDYTCPVQNKYFCITCSKARNNTNNSYVLPFISVFSLDDGQHLADYHFLDEKPLRTKSSRKVNYATMFSFNMISNNESGMVCLASHSSPYMLFLDSKDGSARGIRLGHDLRMNHKKLYLCFNSICSDSDRIYALFFGAEAQDDRNNSKFLVLDWEGNILNCFQLDGAYIHMDIGGDTLYLTRSLYENQLFRLPLSSLID